MEQAVARIDWTPVTEAIAQAEQRAAVIGAALIAPGGERFCHNGARRFVAASTVKVPLMITLFRAIDSGGQRLGDTYMLCEKDRAPGSGVLLRLHAGITLTLGDLVYLMISISDNTATNVLIERIGMAEVNVVMRALGMQGSTLERPMRDHAALPGGPENWATPDDYGRAIAALFDNSAASPLSCTTMVAYLEKQQNERRIARFLPKGNRPRWGSKTGSLAGIVNDVGFIETPHGVLVLSLFCEIDDPFAGEEMIGAISRAAWQAASADRA